MVDRYNEIVKTSGGSHATIYAVVGDFLTTERPPASLDTPDLQDFDIAAVGLGFHHFDSPSLAVHRLAERLKPGGVILIVDFVAEGGGWGIHKGSETVKAHGFSEEQMVKLFEDEGLIDCAYHVMQKPLELAMDERRPVAYKKAFFARAKKPVL